MEESRSKVEIQKLSFENRVAIMREVKKLQSQLIIDIEVLGMVPEEKGMLQAHEES